MSKLIPYLYKLKSSKEFSDIFYLLILQGVNYISPLVIIPYLMVVLGAEKYGYVGFSISFLSYFVLFVDFGFGLSATKRIAIAKEQSKEALSKIFFSTLYSKLVLLVISTALFLILSFCIPQFKKYQITMLCTYPMLIGNAVTFSWLYQGIGKIKVFSLINTISKLLIIPLTFILVKTAQDYNTAAFLQSFVFVLAGVISIFHLIQMRIISYCKVSFMDIKIEMKESLPLFLSGVATSMYTQLFTVILGVVATPNVVGRYSAAERIMRSLCFVLYTPISLAFYPKMVSLAAVDRAAARKLLKKLLHCVSGIMFSIWGILFFFSDMISNLLGRDYEEISNILKIMAFAPLAIGLGGILGQMGLIAMGNSKTKRDFQIVYFIVAPISLLLVTILTSFFIEIGAAIALLLTEYLVLILMIYFNKKHLSMNINS